MKKLGVGHFYVHYFDVDWNEGLHIPVPKGVADYYSLPQGISHYTPVVFITNRTFEHISDAWCDTLAVKITNRINERNKHLVRNYVSGYLYNEYKTHPRSIPYYEVAEKLSEDSVNRIVSLNREIQIDCDWTAGTRGKYFRFLEKLKELNPGRELSVTIRLYPYKYKQAAGVPPADRGVLMCYNMGGIANTETRNSIFDIKELKDYLGAEKYPLPLDIALPAFGWHVWFRGGKFKGIIHGGGDLDRFGRALTLKGKIYQVNTDTVIDNNYYREGDEFRPELPDEDDLEKAANLLAKKIPDYRRIIFFDWNDLSTTKYEKVIQQVFDRH